MQSRNLCARFASCLSSACSYTYTKAKHTLGYATIATVPICYAGNAYIGAASFLRLISAAFTNTNPITLTIGGICFGSALLLGYARSGTIYNYFIRSDETPSSEYKQLTPPEIKTTEKKLEPSIYRYLFAKTLRGFLNLISVLHIPVNNTQTYLGLTEILEFLPGTSEVYLALAMLALFDLNYLGYQLDTAFKNSEKFEKAINEKKYDIDKCKLALTSLCLLPSLFSIPTSGYFSTTQAIPKLPLLNKMSDESIEITSIIAAIIKLITIFPMIAPAIYKTLSEGVHIEVPDDQSNWVKYLSCGLTKNKWILLRNGFIFPFGIIDNLSSAAFSASGFAYTIPKVFHDLSPHAPLSLVLITLVGASSAMSTFAFVTLGSLRNMIDTLNAENPSSPKASYEIKDGMHCVRIQEQLSVTPVTDLKTTLLQQPSKSLPKTVASCDEADSIQSEDDAPARNVKIAPLTNIRIDPAPTPARNSLWAEGKKMNGVKRDAAPNNFAADYRNRCNVM